MGVVVDPLAGIGDAHLLEHVAKVCLEKVCVEAVEDGKYTKDLARSVQGTLNPPRDTWLTSIEFMDELDKRLKAALS